MIGLIGNLINKNTVFGILHGSKNTTFYLHPEMLNILIFKKKTNKQVNDISSLTTSMHDKTRNSRLFYAYLYFHLETQ